MLNGLQNVNAFCYTPQVTLNQGDTALIAFQLTDASINTALKGFNPPGLRFMPAVGATMTATLTNLDEGLAINARPCAQPYPTQDPSIWTLPLQASDMIVGTCDLIITLVQNGIVSSARIPAAVLIQSLTGCGC